MPFYLAPTVKKSQILSQSIKYMYYVYVQVKVEPNCLTLNVYIGTHNPDSVEPEPFFFKNYF